MSKNVEKIVARRRDVLGRLRALLIQDLKVRREPGEIDPDVPLFGTGLRLDSVDAVELIVCVESAFAIKVPEDARSRAALRTLNTLADFVISLEDA